MKIKTLTYYIFENKDEGELLMKLHIAKIKNKHLIKFTDINPKYKIFAEGEATYYETMGNPISFEKLMELIEGKKEEK